MNDAIPENYSKVNYAHIDEVIDIALRLGKCAAGSRLDIRSAFKNLPLNFRSLRFTAFTLCGRIYISSSLPFGSASSCFIFEKVSTLVQWVVTNETARTELSHYLDDFPLLGRSIEDTRIFMNQFTHIVTRIGLPIAHDKTIGPTTCLEYLGMLLDFKEQVLGIPEKKRNTCIQLITKCMMAFRERTSVTVKSIQKLAGHLNFVVQAIPAGKTFMSGLYSLLASGKKNTKPGHHRRVNREMHDDLQMFRSFLDELSPETHRTIPFMVRRNIDARDIQFLADSSGSHCLGLGCCFGDRWAQGFWSETTLFSNGYVPNIALLELLAITIAFEMWAPEFPACTITLRSDNRNTCDWLASKRSDIPAAMDLIRHITKKCLLFQIFIKPVWIKGKNNRKSDLISRNRLKELFKENPLMKPVPEKLPTTLWPPSWSIEQMQQKY